MRNVDTMLQSSMLPRIAPFALFMVFIGCEEAVRFLVSRGLIELQAQTLTYLYPIKTISVAFVLYLFRNSYPEIDVRQLLSLRKISVSVLCGVVVFVLWINIGNSLEVSGGFNPFLFEEDVLKLVMVGMRLVGAVLVVPIMEELFWRSFFLRYIVHKDFTTVSVGTFTWPSFLVVTLLFGLEHNLFLAGIMAGAAYNLLLYYTRSIVHCTLAHMVTNLLLGIYVLATQRWYFW